MSVAVARAVVGGAAGAAVAAARDPAQQVGAGGLEELQSEWREGTRVVAPTERVMVRVAMGIGIMAAARGAVARVKL